MENNKNSFIQQNSPDGGFLQSNEWKNFQEAVGRKTYHLEGESFWANIIKHQLPIVGKYFYIPRGPILKKSSLENNKERLKKIIKLAKKEKAGWIRIEPVTKNQLVEIEKNINYKIQKAPHDMQPREVLVVDILKTEEELLAQMKSKTRYNIRLAGKKNVKIIVAQEKNKQQYLEEFWRLAQITAKRQGIVSHPKEYYQKMIATIPRDKLNIFVAQYQGQVTAVNLVIFFGEMATYLHGASDDKYKNVMASYLLQWQQMRIAQKKGMMRYDFGGVSIESGKNSWRGITRFKSGFSPKTKPVKFPGSYDIIINPMRYYLYRTIQNIRSLKNKKF